MSKRVNKKYKDRLFRFIFKEKKELLPLYNALNGTHYTDPDKLEITTLEDVVYMNMKNDVSFLFGATLNLFEHQSSDNPNMPLRGLFYFARLFRKYEKKQKLNIYSNSLQRLPFRSISYFITAKIMSRIRRFCGCRMHFLRRRRKMAIRLSAASREWK